MSISRWNPMDGFWKWYVCQIKGVLSCLYQSIGKEVIKFISPVESLVCYFFMIYTVHCLYNLVNFLQYPYNRHPIAHPWGRGMECLLWGHHSATVITVPYVISWKIGLRYNGTWLYLHSHSAKTHIYYMIFVLSKKKNVSNWNSWYHEYNCRSLACMVVFYHILSTIWMWLKDNKIVCSPFVIIVTVNM